MKKVIFTLVIFGAILLASCAGKSENVSQASDSTIQTDSTVAVDSTVSK